MNLLLFKLNNLGDNIVFVPTVAALRRALPEARITLITTPAESVLYTGVLARKDILTSGKLAFDKCWRRPWELAAWWLRIRARRPDACLVAFDQANIPHLLAKHSGARLRVGGNLEHIRIKDTLTHHVPLPAGGRPVEYNWETARVLAAAIGAPPLPATPPPPELSHLLSPMPRAARRRIVIHGGSSKLLTRWPTERFAALAARLAADHEVLWIERPEIQAAALDPAVRRCPPGSLAQFASLLATADLFVGNNSGPMHLANALGRPGVIVAGASALGWDPYWFRERWTVLRHPSLACQPCERPDKETRTCANTAAPFACLTYWSVDAVEAACRETLSRTART